MSVEVRHISHRLGDVLALDDVSLTISDGELVALLGPSGSGKTTLLRVIAGLEPPDVGDVLFDNHVITHRKPAERGVGFVFQHYALFGHMTVFENVAFGLRVRPRQSRPSEQQIQKRVQDVLSLVQLESMARRHPSQLSGGQRQRVALARALAVAPRVLLLDEPFGALDARVRQELRRWLRSLHTELHITSIFVTHDQEEALEVADRVAIMERGKLVQVGTPREIYDQPANVFVYRFLGHANRIPARLENGAVLLGDGLALPSSATSSGLVSEGVAYVRPHDLDVARSTESRTDGLRATIQRVAVVGPHVRLDLVAAVTGENIEVELRREPGQELEWRVGDTVSVRPRSVQFF